ncbi:hypothetical protein QCA50_013780 [Cerrena zonata]|uniref:Uncharacterized protein n=1 Tax=Cerrena zonata TaxID=2478898 RepID=A0AAW0FSN2_9APHY
MRYPPPLGRKLSRQHSLRTSGNRAPITSTRTPSASRTHESSLPSSSGPPPPPDIPREDPPISQPDTGLESEFPYYYPDYCPGWTDSGPMFDAFDHPFIDPLYGYPELSDPFSSCTTDSGIHGDDNEAREPIFPTYTPSVPKYTMPLRRRDTSEKKKKSTKSKNAKESIILSVKGHRDGAKRFPSPPPNITGAYAIYKWKWDILRKVDRNFCFRFRDLPWPVLFRLRRPAELTSKAVAEFLVDSSRMEDLKIDSGNWSAMRRSLLKEQVLWHPDKFNTMVDLCVRPMDREKAKRAGMEVAQLLNTYCGFSSTQELKDLAGIPP